MADANHSPPVEQCDQPTNPPLRADYPDKKKSNDWTWGCSFEEHKEHKGRKGQAPQERMTEESVAIE